MTSRYGYTVTVTRQCHCRRRSFTDADVSPFESEMDVRTRTKLLAWKCPHCGDEHHPGGMSLFADAPPPVAPASEA